MRLVRTIAMSLLVVVVLVSFAGSPPIGTAYIALVAVSSLDMNRDPVAPEPDAKGCHARGFGLEGTSAPMPIGDKAAATVSAFAAASKGLIDWVLSESGFQVTPMPGCSAWSAEWAIQCARIAHRATAVIISATVKSPSKTHALWMECALRAGKQHTGVAAPVA